MRPPLNSHTAMRDRPIVWLTFLLLGISTACSTPEYLPKEALQVYLQDPDNGLTRKMRAGEVQMTVTYRPNDLLVQQEVGDAQDTSAIRKAFEKYEDHAYFTVQLAAGERDALYGGSADQAAFSEHLQTLSFRMGEYVQLTTSAQDTIPVADFYYSRNFGLSKSSDILFVFNNEKLKNSNSLSFHVKEFGFRTGNQSFPFKTKDLVQAPKLEAFKTYYENH